MFTIRKAGQLVTYRDGKWESDNDDLKTIFETIDAARKEFDVNSGLPRDYDELVLNWIRDNFGDVEVVEQDTEPIERVKGRIY